jgi:hypothetical protein
MNTRFHIEITDDMQLVKIQTFLRENPTIKYHVINPVFTDVSYSDEYTYIPTAKFVELCGSENLTKDGRISEKGAINSLLSYAKINNLYFGDFIDLDDYLRHILNISEGFLLINRLPDVLRRLFRSILPACTV